jgi:hypothetical protein
MAYSYPKIHRFGWTCILSQYQDLEARLAPRFLKKLVATHLQILLVVPVWEAPETLMHA